MNSKFHTGTFALSATICATLIAGCASTAPPIDQLTRSKTALLHAEEAGARNHAPLEYHIAMKKYQQAESAFQRKDYKTAATLAEQAEVDANLADAKTEANKAQASVKQLQESIKTLREELNRASLK